MLSLDRNPPTKGPREGRKRKGIRLRPFVVVRSAIATGRLRRGGNSNGMAATMRQQQQHGSGRTIATGYQQQHDSHEASAPNPLPTHSTRPFHCNHPFCAHGFAAKPPLVGGSPSAEPPPLRKRLEQYCESVRRGGAPSAPIHTGATRRGHVRNQAFMSRRKPWSARQTR